MNVEVIGVLKAHALRLTGSCELLFTVNVGNIALTVFKGCLPVVPGVDRSCCSAH